MPAVFSWFPGTCEHRFLYVPERWIKLKVEPCGVRSSHLLSPQPANLWWCSMRCCLAVQNELQDTSQNSKTWKEREKKKRNSGDSHGEERPCCFAEWVRELRGGTAEGQKWTWHHWGELRCWGEPEQEQTLQHLPALLVLVLKVPLHFIHQIFQFCSVHTAFPVWASRPPQSLPRVPCVSWEQPGALGALLPPPCIEIFWEQEATLQLLQIAEKPWPLGLSFSRICAFHRPQMNFKKHWSHFIFPKVFQGLS